MRQIVRTATLSTILMGGVVVTASAAPITWGALMNESDNPSDVLTTGTFVDSAIARNVDVTLNGVTFNRVSSWTGAGANATFNASNIQVLALAGLYDWHAGIFGYGSFVNLDYRNFIDGAMFGNATWTPEIILGGLTIGEEYNVQLFQGQWNNNWETGFIGGGNPTAGLLDLGVDFARPQYVIGSFTADAVTQAIQLTGPTPNVFVNAIQLRTAEDVAPVPEPASVASMGVGLSILAAVLRARRR